RQRKSTPEKKYNRSLSGVSSILTILQGPPFRFSIPIFFQRIFSFVLLRIPLLQFSDVCLHHFSQIDSQSVARFSDIPRRRTPGNGRQRRYRRG
ncbi:MAG: hypothetical protein KKD30_05520, partial [Gammaproteobacteria bacterium]|nr:hypothetical protein [Gammaproteobacteria bacterium]